MTMVYLLIENGIVKYVTEEDRVAEYWVTARPRIAIKREVKSVPIYDACQHHDLK